MQRMNKPLQWIALGAVLLVIGTTMFIRQPFMMERLGWTHISTSHEDQDKEETENRLTREARKSYQVNCMNLATHPQTSISSSLDDCYQSLLANFSSQLLNDVSSLLFTPHFTASQATKIVTTLDKMNEAGQQASVTRLAAQMGYKGDMAVWERQELVRIDQGKVSLHTEDGYDPAVGKPLLNQLVRQLPTIGNLQLDIWFAHAILASPLSMNSVNSINEVNANRAVRVVPPQYSGNLIYHGGRIIDGIANVYLIFWEDAAVQRIGPKYISLAEQFIKDVGRTPLYANLKQYRNSAGQYPVTARLADATLITSHFPADVVALQAAGKDPFSSPKWDQEIERVAMAHHWNMYDYHNLFILFPTMSSSLCGWHGFLTINGQIGSPRAFVTYPFDTKGKQVCTDVPHSPNHDPAADVAVDTLGHEIMEAVSDPYLNAWYAGNSAKPDSSEEMADKCAYSPPGIDDSKYYGINPQTGGNITWNGHIYMLQPEYSNFRHGCVWAGP